MVILNIGIGVALFISLIFNFYLIKKLNKKDKEMEEWVNKHKW